MNADVLRLAHAIENLGYKLCPCVKEEINMIESISGVKLPEAYKDFLLLMGRGAGDLMAGSSVFFDEIFDLDEGAKELLMENNVPELPENAYVFWMHQGYQFAFFLAGNSQDPEVYYYCEGQSEFELTNLHFTDFLKLQAQSLKAR